MQQTTKFKKQQLKRDIANVLKVVHEVLSLKLASPDGFSSYLRQFRNLRQKRGQDVTPLRRERGTKPA